MRGDLTGKMLVEAAAVVGRGGGGEAGPVALGLGGERELADDERRPAGVEQRAVHAAGLVLEDAQVDDLARQPFRLLLAVALHGADQHQQPLPDLAGDRAVDGDGGRGNTLDERAHEDLRKTSLTSTAIADCGAVRSGLYQSDMLQRVVIL